MSFPLLILFVATSLLPTFCSTEKFFVSPTPPPNPACPSGKPCHTLDEYAQNEELYFGLSSNIYLLFLDGTHEMSATLLLEVSDKQQLILSSFNSSFEFNYPQAIVRSMSARFARIQMLKVENISISMGYMSTVGVCSVAIFQVVNQQHPVSILQGSKVLIQGSSFIESSFSFDNVVFQDVNCITLFNQTLTFKMSNSNFKGIDSVLKINFLSSRSLELAISTRLTLYDVELDQSSVSISPSLSSISSVVLEIFRFSISSGHVELGGYGSSITAYYIENSSFINIETTVYAQILLLRNVLFGHTANKKAVLSLRGPMNATVDSCEVYNNIVFLSTMTVHKVNLYFIGNSTFSNNVASNGGAIFMSRSIIWLQKGAHVSFFNNSATQIGGALSIRERVVHELYAGQLGKPCFFQLISSDIKEGDVSLVFSNNHAKIGGNDIFGAALRDDCDVSDHYSPSFYYFKKVIKFQTPSISSVSSHPNRVCLCDDSGVPQCENIDYIYYNMSVTPGEVFTLSAVLVGADYGTVTGSVYASSINERQSKFIFAPGQNSQEIDIINKCSALNYSVYLTSRILVETIFILSKDSVTAASQRASLNDKDSIYSRKSLTDRSDVTMFSILPTAPVVITVRLLPCPRGFELGLINIEYVCQCKLQLKHYVYKCVVENSYGKHFRNGTTWIGCSGGNQSDTILAHSLCPFDYCKAEPVAINLYNPDPQCALNHSGILCGGCPPNLSLAIGSSRCLPCPDNKFVPLFLVFALAGILLILLIKVLDLTVSHGTIIGLIFYANAVWIHQGIFFSVKNETTDSDLLNYFTFLKIFVAWLNLDFGIETCFIQGLTAYWKIWLQLVFPFYIWILARLIVVACHYSTRATKLFGNNAVPVLATLFLLSYAKLLRVIVLALGPAVLHQFHPDGARWVWLMDGNVPYLGLHHAFLFIMALLVLFLLWLPYIVMLLCIRHLRKLPCDSIYGMVVKFKPLFDSYTGPFKIKCQFWVGLTLLVHVLLAISAVSFQAISPVISIDILLLVCALLCIVAVHVFKKWLITCLELSFLFNLIILSITFVSTDDAKRRLICMCVSVTIAFVIFIGIILYHVYFSLKRCFPFKTGSSGTINVNTSDQVEIPVVSKPQPTVSSTTVDLREHLLESDSHLNL